MNFLKYKWLKILSGTLLLAMMMMVVAAVYLNRYWSPILANRLKTTVLKTTDSLYTLTFSNIELHVIKGEIIIENILLKADTNVYNRKKKAHIAPNTLYEVHLKKIVIGHIHPYRLYRNRELNIDQITINEPDLHIRYEQNRLQDTTLKNKKTPYQYISKVLKSLRIQTLLLNGVKVNYANYNGGKVKTSEYGDINIKATDFLLDSASMQNTTRFLFCNDVSAELNNIAGNTQDKRYHYKIKQLNFSTSVSKLSITGMSLLPNMRVANFFKNNADDCFALKLDSLTLTHFDFKAFSKYHKISGTCLSLANGSVQIFSNPAVDDTTIDQSKNFPQARLRHLPIEIKLDTIKINETNIFFTDYNKKSGDPGTVNFQRLSGVFLNVTNSKAALQQNNMATAKLRAYLMNYGLMNVEFAFNLTDEQNTFTYKGTVGGIDLERISQVTIPLALIKISSGKLQQLTFDMRANNYNATGHLKALYSNLKVSIYKRKEDNTLKRMGIVSLLANELVIKRDNPMMNGPQRIIKINYERKLSASIFNEMWKSLFTGIKETVGFDAQTERTIRQKIATFKQDKIDRQAKKAERKTRREERQKRRELKRRQNSADSLNKH